MEDENIETLAELAEQADNLVAASRLPLEPRIHVEQLRSGLEEMRDRLRDLYVAEGGYDHWAD